MYIYRVSFSLPLCYTTALTLMYTLVYYYLQCPENKSEWKAVADKFQSNWQLPNFLGALDGKHVILRPPIGSGSTYFNYKSSFSIVLMALVDADYKFLWVDVGCNGRISDGGVYDGCSLQQALSRRSDMFPDAAPCPGDQRPLQYYIVTDDAFPLQDNMMKPFSHKDMIHQHRIFNCRLSRARRVVENAFGILSNRFRVFFTKIALEGDEDCACALHNMLREEIGTAPGVADVEDPQTHHVTTGSWRDDPILAQARLPSGTNTTARAKALREYLVKYVNSQAGSVSWQDSMLG